jgi:hypothetical protein
MISPQTLPLDTGTPTAHEHFMQTVERFIMGVTENLCRLENENVEPGQEEAFRRSKTRILAELDKLDGMLASYRAGNPQQLLDALRIVADMAVSRSLPPSSV